MNTARFLVGDAFEVLATLEPESIDCLITSPPYPWQRSYLPADHPDKDKELGREATPGEALGALLRMMDAAWPVLTKDATFWVNLGDVHSGSGGSGGDYDEGGMRAGQPRYNGSGSYARRENRRRDRVQDTALGVLPPQMGNHWRGVKPGYPLEQSVCHIPHLFSASLAYGRNLLTGEPCRQWVVRPPVTWCKPSPSVGRLDRRFRSATELIAYGGKHQHHFFDLDAVRTPASGYRRDGAARSVPPGQKPRGCEDKTNENGAPPYNWWNAVTEVLNAYFLLDPSPSGNRATEALVDSGLFDEGNAWVVNHPGYPAAHFATFPPELILRPVLAGCPVGGTILDPFAGSGTVGAVATGNNRNAVLIDLDERNVELARQRIGMFLEEVSA